MNLTDKISLYCTYGEAIRSETASRMGIQNIPDETQLQAMKFVATTVFDKIREHFGPLHVNSFLRVPALNSSTPGASKTSKHMMGQAIDISIIGRNMEIFKWVYENIKELDLDQLIFEFGTKDYPDWVHVARNSGTNRYEILRAYHDTEGNPVYRPFDLW